MALAALYSLPDIRVAFGGPYVTPEDARQHTYWTRRYQDASLFPHDPVADYFQGVTPAGYKLLFRAAAAAGLDPVAFGKALPVPLAVASAGYVFGLTALILPSPAAAFLASVSLSQQLWLSNELPSGAPRAFAIPLLAAFLYYLARDARMAALVCLALQGLFYPQILLVACGTLVLTLVRLERGHLRLSRNRLDWTFCVAGLATAIGSVLPFFLSSSRFGPTVTADEARRMPEFYRGGQLHFFGHNAWDFWVSDRNSGFLGMAVRGEGAYRYAAAPLVWGGLFLPVVLAARRRFSLASRVTPTAGLLLRTSLASLLLFAAAHALLFQLQLPNRYSRFSARVLLVVAGAVTCTILEDAVRRRLPRRGFVRGALLLAGSLGAAVFFVSPLLRASGAYVVGQAPELYRFLQEQPKDVVVASIARSRQHPDLRSPIRTGGKHLRLAVSARLLSAVPAPHARPTARGVRGGSGCSPRFHPRVRRRLLRSGSMVVPAQIRYPGLVGAAVPSSRGRDRGELGTRERARPGAPGGRLHGAADGATVRRGRQMPAQVVSSCCRGHDGRA